VAPPPQRDELQALYKIALEEYRYEVSLSWDRLKHYFLVTAGLTTAGATLSNNFGGMHGSLPSDLMVATVFLVGACSAALGIMAVVRSREYYRMTVYKKTLIEHLLGYDQRIDQFTEPNACLSIGTTRGMRSLDVLKWSEQDIRKAGPAIGSLVWYSSVALGLSGLVDLSWMSFLVLRHAIPFVISLLFHACA
jgi:hypothetical protein